MCLTVSKCFDKMNLIVYSSNLMYIFIFKIKISNQMESLNIANSVSIVCHYINKIISDKKN